MHILWFNFMPSLPRSAIHSITRAALINCYKLEDFKHINLFPSSSGGQKPKWRCWQGYTLSESSREIFCLPLIVSSCSMYPLAYVCMAPMSAPIFVCPSSFLSLTFPSLIRTLVFGLRAHSDKTEWAHLESLNLYMYKMLFPSKFWFPGSWG